MSTPTISISATALQVLQELADQTGQTITEVLDQALGDYCRKVRSSANGRPGPGAQEDVAVLQAQAWAAFSRDLPTLLRTSAGKWVAYRGAKQECTGESQSAVHQECSQRGLTPEELFVELVYPAALEEPMVFLPPTEELVQEES